MYVTFLMMASVDNAELFNFPHEIKPTVLLTFFERRDKRTHQCAEMNYEI